MRKIEDLLKEETLKQVELEPVVTVQKSDSIQVVIDKINQHWVRSAVVTEEGVPKGVFTQRDVLLKVALEDVDLESPVENVMSEVPGTLTLGSNLKVTIDLMNEQRRRSIPIIDPSGKTVGVATSRALVKHLSSHFPKSVYNLPPDPHQTSSAQEGA